MSKPITRKRITPTLGVCYARKDGTIAYGPYFGPSFKGYLSKGTPDRQSGEDYCRKHNLRFAIVKLVEVPDG